MDKEFDIPEDEEGRFDKDLDSMDLDDQLFFYFQNNFIVFFV